MKTPPEKIWLQWFTPYEENASWCSEKINENDIEYALVKTEEADDGMDSKDSGMGSGDSCISNRNSRSNSAVPITPVATKGGEEEKCYKDNLIVKRAKLPCPCQRCREKKS